MYIYKYIYIYVYIYIYIYIYNKYISENSRHRSNKTNNKKIKLLMRMIACSRKDGGPVTETDLQFR